jgi:hypothetical protein
MPHPVPKELNRAAGRDGVQLTERSRTERRRGTAAGRTLPWEDSPPRRRRGEIFAVAKPALCWDGR